LAKPKSERPSEPKPANPDPKDSPVTVGRTQWDALVDIVKILGNGAPYFLIIVVAGFGFYKFQEAQRTAQAEATKNYEQQLSAANKALIETYQSLGTISGTQIKNLSDMLELHGKATTRTQELQQAQEQLRKQAEQQTATLDQARREAEVAVDRKKQVEADREKLDIELSKGRIELEKGRTELDKLEVALQARKLNLTDSAEQVSLLRGRMLELAQAVKDENPEAGDLAIRILGQNDLSSPTKLVSEASRTGTFPEALKDLIGRSEAELINLLRNDSHFAFIINRGGSTFLAAGPPANNVFQDIIQIETDGTRIVSAGKYDGVLFGIQLPNEDDWYSTMPIIIRTTVNSMYTSNGKENEPDWDLGEMEPSEIIRSLTYKPRYLNIDQFREVIPPKFQNIVVSFNRVHFSMYDRSRNFDAASLLALPGIPGDVRDTAVKLLNAAVKSQIRDAANYVVEVPPNRVLGQAAAIILHPDFEFISGQPVDGTGETREQKKSVLLVGHYDYKTGGWYQSETRRERIATFRFSQQEASPWKLEQLSSALKEKPLAEK
jgi:hypothetical protein